MTHIPKPHRVRRDHRAVAARIPPPGSKAMVLLPHPTSKKMDDIPTEVTVKGRVRCVQLGERCGSPEPLMAYWVRCLVDSEKEPRDIAIERFLPGRQK